MIPGGDKYVWLVWALTFLVPWVVHSIFESLIFCFTIGGVGVVWCRYDLKFNTLIGGVLFLGFHTLFMQGVP